jgi:hypothetical protein
MYSMIANSCFSREPTCQGIDTRESGGSTMGPMGGSWQEYERQRRRLNSHLGLIVFGLLPLPAILIALGVSPLRMLLIVASLGAILGILYPMWWRSKHNPFRASVEETRTRRIAWVCRPGGFLCALAATLSWSVGSMVAEWIALALGAASALLLLFSYFSDKKAQQSLR